MFQLPSKSLSQSHETVALNNERQQFQAILHDNLQSIDT
jgi:hypothetical protein